MTLIEHRDLVQGSQEWLDARLGMVTASVVGKLVSTRALTGIDYSCPECESPANAPCLSLVKRGGESSPIKTLHQGRTDVARASGRPPLLEVANTDESNGLTALLVAERITGLIEPVYVSDDMLRGQMDEPLARDVYAEHFAPVRELGFMVREEPTWKLGYSPDGLVGDDGLIEIKSRRQKKQLTTILADEVPPENMAQLQAGLLVTGRAWCDYVSYCGGMPLYAKRVYPDPRWFAAITAAVEQFEKTAAEMVTRYEAAVAGLPKTVRVSYDDDIVISAVAA